MKLSYVSIDGLRRTQQAVGNRTLRGSVRLAHHDNLFTTLAHRLRDWWDYRVVRRFALAALIRRTGNFSDVRWLGHPVWQNIADIWSLQEAINDEDVDLVVECGTNQGGLALFLATLFDIRGRGSVISIDVAQLATFTHPRIDFIVGSSTDSAVVKHVHERVAELRPRHPIVLLDSDHSEDHVLGELRAYANLVGVGDFIVVQDGVIDELRLFRAGRPGPLSAVKRFLAEDPRFEVDVARSRRFLLSHSPSGWLRRIR